MPEDNSHSAWFPAPDSLKLQSRQVDVWRVSLNPETVSIKLLESHLSGEETRRAARFHFPADRDRFIAAHGFLREVLARYLHCEPGEMDFSTNKYGKPAIKHHQLEFNLSHSGEHALVAVALEHKVGVDVERIRSGISSPVIARQYFSKSEVAELEALALEQREAAFFACWTRKEAYIKAQGMGLSLPLDSFDVSLIPDKPAVLRATRPDPSIATRWMLKSLEIDPNYAGALAVEGRDLEFRLWNWHAETRLIQ